MKIITVAIACLLVLLVAGCAQKEVVQEPTQKPAANPDLEKPTTSAGATGDAVVDGVGDDLAAVSNEEKELDDSDLDDMDKTLEDIENS